MTAFADFIAQKNLESPVWVLKIDAATDVYLSTIPLAGLATELPLISAISGPSQSVPYTGGGASVSTLTVTVLDILDAAGTTYKASNALYSNSVIGCACTLYMGDSTEATWSETYYAPVWRGYVREVNEKNGKWEVRCEDLLSKAKGHRLEIDESFLTVAVDFQAKDHALEIKGRRVMPTLPALSTLASNGTFDASLTGWTWTCTGGSATWGASYGRTGGGVRVNSGAANTGAFHQTITLPGTHLPGRTYSALIDATTGGTATATRYQLRVQIEVLDASSNVLEVSTGTARRVRPTGTWGTHSASVTVYHPSAVSLKVSYIVGTDGTNAVSLDNARVYVASHFLSLKREIYAALEVDETTTPNQLDVAHGVLSTRENKQPQGEKGKFVVPLVGYGADILLRILTTTDGGANGDWDWGDGFGCGIPIDHIDATSFMASRTALPYHLFALLLSETETDALRYLEAEILKPMGAWLTFDHEGKLALGYLPETVGSASITITDDSVASRSLPVLERRRDEVINQVNAFSDYDYMGACETRSSRDLGKKANNIVVDSGGPEGDSKYVGRWTFDEEDHRQDGVFKDQNLTSQGQFGIHAKEIKAKGLRGLPSYSSGMPCPLYNWGVTSAYAWQSETALRSLATRWLTFFSVPPCYVKHTAFAEALEWDIGSIGDLTLTNVPNHSGGRGITSVTAMLVGRSIKPLAATVEVTWLILDSDWYHAPTADQPVYSYGTAPGSGNIDVVVADADTVKAGNFAYVLSGQFGALIIKQNYGGVTGAVPDFNAYAYTEVRIQWNSGEDSHTKGKITTARFNTSRLMIALPGALSGDDNALEDIGAIDVLWRYKDGTYSAAYSYGTSTPGVDIEEEFGEEKHFSGSVSGRGLVNGAWETIKTRHFEGAITGRADVRGSWDGINVPPSTPTIGTLASADQDIQGTRRVECDLTVPLTFSACHKLHIEVKEWNGSAVTAKETEVVDVRGLTSYTYYKARKFTRGRTLYVRVWGERGTGLSSPSTSDANWALTPPTVPAGHSITAGGSALPTGPSITGLTVKTRKRNHTDFQAAWTTSTNYNREIEVEITYDSGTTWEPLKVVNVWNKRTTGKARIRVQHMTEYEAPCVRLLMRDKFGVESSYYPDNDGTDSAWWASEDPAGGGENPITKWPWTFTGSSTYDSTNKRIDIGSNGTATLNIPLHKQRIAMHGDWSFNSFASAHWFGFIYPGAYDGGYRVYIDDASHVTLQKVNPSDGSTTTIGTQQTLTTTLTVDTPVDFRFEVHKTKIVLIIGPTSQRLTWTDTSYRYKGWNAKFCAGALSKTYLESLRVDNNGEFYNGLATSNVQANLDSDGYIAGGNVQFEISSTKRKLATMAAKVGSDIYISGDFIRERDPVTSATMPTTDIKAGMIQPFYESGGSGAGKYRIGVMIPADFFGSGVPASDIWAHVNCDSTISAGSASTATGGSAGTGGTCFRGDMEIPTEAGSIRLDAIKPNDVILSVDQLTGNIVRDYVISVHKHEPAFCLLLNGRLAVTEEHYLFRWDRGRPPASCPQVTAGEFPLGGLLCRMDRDALTPEALSSKVVFPYEWEVYSLTTSTKCFLVGSGGVYYLAHNAKSLDI